MVLGFWKLRYREFCLKSLDLKPYSNISCELNILSKEVGSGLSFYTPPVFHGNTLLHVIFNYSENCSWEKEI